ncbi:MAG: Ppx/GppA family phosphatase [Thalassobaculaceae bacterium]|nr:Ppx/GppA family phosphatase [Thalassobaculaceae bacterium]
MDIGSNSIRLVVYDHEGLSPIPVFNEKALCGLGRGLDETGELAPDAMGSALTNLQRYAEIASAMRVGRLDVLATSAVRDASNGAAFVSEIERRTGYSVRIIGGDEEARLAALGVISGFPDADGVVGDLGGGSLELIDVSDQHLGAHTTMPVGPLRIGDVEPGERRRMASLIDGYLREAPWLSNLSGRTLYAVGGAWRSVAKAHMAATKYPIEVIHGYTIDRTMLSDFLSVLARSSKKAIRSTPGISRRRADTMATAALVLQRVLARGKPDRIVFSAFGLREGCVFDRLPEEERHKDPLLVAAVSIARETNRFAPPAETVFNWLQPLFGTFAKRDERLVRALCMLSDMAWAEHPSYRGEHAFLRVSRLPVAGLDHADRVFLGLGMLARYSGHVQIDAARKVDGLLDPERRALAVQVGLALRLGLTLSGGATALLRRTRIEARDDGFALSIAPDAVVLIGEVVERRVQALAGALERSILMSVRPARAGKR